MKSRALVAVLAGLLAACTPQQHLLMSLVPEGTVSALLSHLDTLADTNRKRVVELEQKADWDGLARFAEENLARDRYNSEWWFVAGYAYMQLKRYPRAIECYTEMVRIDPQDPDGWQSLAQAYRADGRPERAVRVLSQYLLVDRSAPATHLLLGESLSDMRRWNDALHAYRAALDRDGGLAGAWYGWGRAHAMLGRPAEAREALTVLEKSAPALAAQLARDLAGVSGSSAPGSGGAR